jgi:hypothetical protein
VTENRTAWPINGGAVAFQPGWFTGHSTSLMYINIGLGAQPANYSTPIVPMFEITGPTNQPYPGTVCLPSISLPAGMAPKNGDLATIQLVQAAKHGAALFNVSISSTQETAGSRVPASSRGSELTEVHLVRRHHLYRRRVEGAAGG